MNETTLRDLNDMAIFVAIADAGSLTLAASRTGLPKSNVSRRLMRLEQRLGTRLMERNTRSLRLTAAGALYLRHCRRMVQAAEEADRCMDYQLEVPRGILRISAPVTLGQQLITGLLPAYLARYAQVQVELILSERPFDLRNEAIDVAVQTGPLPDSTLVAQRVGQYTLHLYAARGYLQQHGTPEQPEALLQHRCLALGNMITPNVWVLQQAARQQEIRINPVASVNDFTALQLLVASGSGIALLPDYFCTRPIGNDARLVRILPHWASPPTPLYAVYPSQLGVTPKVKAFVGLLREALNPFAPDHQNATHTEPLSAEATQHSGRRTPQLSASASG